MVLAAVAVVIFLVLRDQDEGPPPVAGFSFEVGKLRTVPVKEPAGEEQLQRAADRVHSTMNALYAAAFIDPADWREGRFPGLPAFFSGKAAELAAEDLEDLTLGSTAPQMETVKPDPSKLRVTFLIDPKKRPSRAIATTRFAAAGTLEDGRRVNISHGGQYFLEPAGKEWLIIGYDVQGRLEPAAPVAGPSP